MDKMRYASEFRFVYWDSETEYLYYTVKRGARDLRGKWAIQDGAWRSWDGRRWDENLRGADAFRWGLGEALEKAVVLAGKKNAEMVEQLERRFPGQFRGSECDMSAQEAL